MIKFSLTRDQDFVLYIAPCETGDWKNKMRMATEDDLRAAGYVPASPGFTLEHKLENQASSIRDLRVDRDDLKHTVDQLRQELDSYKLAAERYRLKFDRINAVIAGEI